jgi:hypothetical protein
MQRTSGKLSALLEITDDMIDFLRTQKQEYVQSIRNKRIDELDFSEMNIDVLQVVLDFFVPGAKRDTAGTSSLLDIMRTEMLSIADLVRGFNILKRVPETLDIKSFMFKNVKEEVSQLMLGVFALLIGRDDFFERAKEYLKSVDQDQMNLLEEIRNILKSKQG